MFTVKEIFYTIQGEGANAGTPAVFCRFSGCNLWSGREKDRARAICKFCDTEFVGGEKYRLYELVAAIQSFPKALVVFTGGEPMLQLTEDLISSVGDCSVETNGTIDRVPGDYWITVSPKAGTVLKITEGDELKLVYPQDGIDPNDFIHMDFDNFYIQPKGLESSEAAIEYVKQNPSWKLSVQTHKYLGIR